MIRGTALQDLFFYDLCHYSIGARFLSTFLAHYFPDPQRVILGLAELLINAIEHGNLGISYDEKSQLVTQDKWNDEVTKRLAMPEYKDKRVTINFKRFETYVEVHIRDEGRGFDWQQYLEISPERAQDNHGRGIALSNLISFDSIEYLGKGNEVICQVNANKQDD